MEEYYTEVGKKTKTNKNSDDKDYGCCYGKSQKIIHNFALLMICVAPGFSGTWKGHVIDVWNGINTIILIVSLYKANYRKIIAMTA